MTESTGWNEPEPGAEAPAAPPAEPEAPATPEEVGGTPEPEPEPEPDPAAPDIPAGQPDWLSREFGKIHERLRALGG